MSEPQTRLAAIAGNLREAFDRSFAAAYPSEPPAHFDVLAIRVADHAYALGLDEVLALQADRKLVPVPSPHAALLGLVGVRGEVVPVYDLGRLLGHPRAAAPRWLILARTPAPFAVAFELFEAHLRVPRSELIARAEAASAAGAFTRGSITTEAGPRAVLDLPALFAGVTGHSRPHAAPAREERR